MAASTLHPGGDVLACSKCIISEWLSQTEQDLTLKLLSTLHLMVAPVTLL